MKTEFKIGDAVILREDILNTGKSNTVGIVRAFDNIWIGVEFISKKFDGHNLNGTLENRQGYWFSEDTELIELVKKSEAFGFKIGDRVIAKIAGGNDVRNACGTIIEICGSGEYCDIGVLFDKKFNVIGHDLNGFADRNDGWWFCGESVVKETLTLIYDNDMPCKVEEPVNEEGSGGSADIKQVPIEYIWVARDLDGKLFAYIDEPIRDIGNTQYYSEHFKRLKDGLFPTLKFNDGALKIREVR